MRWADAAGIWYNSVMTKQSVITEALKLAEGERLEVAEALYESLEHSANDALEAEWSAEIGKRVNEIDSGQATLLDWSAVKQQIENRGNGADATD